MENFTPVSGLLGGVLIGVASVLMLLFSGRITGISGIVGGMLIPRGHEGAWRAAFLVGLVLGAVVYMLVTGATDLVQVESSLAVLMVAGLLVGFGTRLGSGCTSGHGVCGIARLSKRSITATVVFMVAAVATVFVDRHVF
ncbi:MAG: YeeE/YedE family protein [Actinomycetota bacterium]